MLPRPLWRTIRGALLGAGLLMAGCGVSPQPEPPSIDVSLLDLGQVEGGSVLAGRPGAVKPGSGTLTTLDLDDVTPAISVAVGADGSFTAQLAGTPQHIYRLQAELAALRSEPVDVTGVFGIMPGPASAVPGPLASCFTLDPALEIGPLSPGETITVKLTNACTQPATIGALPLRLGSAAWSIGAPALPLVIPSGGASSFTVTFDPPPSDTRDDILFVEITAPEMGRRPLSLRGAIP